MKFTKPLLIMKLKATAVHLAMSIIVFAYLAHQIYYNWYPQPYFSIDGGWQGIRLVGAVDLVLGPLITFLIFDLNKPKKDIIFDLLIILTIQIGALAYGIYTTYNQRPVAIVVIDQLVVPATMEHYGGTLPSSDDLARYSDEKPPIIYSEFPRDQIGLEEVNRRKIEDKVLEHAQMNLYQEPGQLKRALESRQMVYFDSLDTRNARDDLDLWLATNQKTIDDVFIAPFTGRYGNAWLIFDRNGKYLDYFRSTAPGSEEKSEG